MEKGIKRKPGNRLRKRTNVVLGWVATPWGLGVAQARGPVGRGSVLVEVGTGLPFWREVEVEGGSLALGGVEVDKAAGAGDDAIDGGEAEAGTLFFGLGGEERVEDMLEGIFVHSATGIGNGDTDIGTRFEGAIADTDGHFDLGEAGLDIDLPGSVDGVAGVDEHIEESLV